LSSLTCAPDVTLHGSTYFMYFGASLKDNPGGGDRMCIAVATSESPLGPFRDARGSPLFCSPAQWPYAAIDPKSFDEGGSTYLFFGSDNSPIAVVQLAANRTALSPGAVPFQNAMLVADHSQPYEGLVEGAWIHPRGADHFLFYSGDNCCSTGAHYAVMVARSTSGVLGPYVKLGNATGSGSNVILSEGSGGYFTAPGHNSLITDDAGNDFIFYHSYRNGDLAGPRMLLMDRIAYDEAGWPRVGEPSSTPQAAPVVSAPAAMPLPGSGQLRMLPRLNIVGDVTISGISSGADTAVQFHIANSDIVNGSAIFAGQTYGCAIMRFDADEQFTCAAEPTGPGCAGMPWGPAPCVGCDPGMTLLYDHCKAKPNVTQLPKLVAFAQAAEAAGDIPPLSNLADDAVYLYRGTVDEIYRDGCVNTTASLFEALGVPPAHVFLNAAIPSAHCWPTADVAVPSSSCGQQNSPGAPPAMENCGFDGAGAALQYLFNNSLTAPANVSAFDPNNLLMFYQFHYFAPNAWAGQGKQGWLYQPPACQQGKPCRLHIALHGCGMSASNPAMNMSFVMHTGLNAWADANSFAILYPQMGGFIDYNRTAPTPQLGGGCFDGYGQTGVDFASQTGPQMLAIREMIAAIRGGNVV
jgi:arabinan endo-1,5-alpha-L-arabinosidase